MKPKIRPPLPTLPIRKPRPEAAPETAQANEVSSAETAQANEVSSAETAQAQETVSGRIPERPVFDEEYEARIEKYREKCEQYEMYGGVNPKFPGANHYEVFGGTKADDFLNQTMDEVTALFENGMTDPVDLWKAAEANASMKIEAWWHPKPEKKVWQ